MSSKTLCAWVRFSVAAFACCGAFFLAVLPLWTKDYLSARYGLLASYLWLGFLLFAAMPCCAVLVLVWRVSGAIRDETVFTARTAKTIGTAAAWLFGDAVFIFSGNIALLFVNFNHPGVILAALAVVFVLIAFGVLAAVLSRYIQKAADLQEISEGTI